MSSPLKALIVEDNPNDADLLVLELERGGFQVEFERVDMPEPYKTALGKRDWDVIFSDHSMPKFSSFQALQLRNESGLDIPFIILSGTMGEDLAVEAMRAGASDYFVKGGFTRLIPAVNRELQDAKQRETGRKTEWELEHFVASLTHDLRTPILAESRVLELLASGKFGDLNTGQLEVIQELVQSNQFVQHMVQNILFTYKYKQRQVQLHRESTDLSQFTSALVDSIMVQTLLQEHGHCVVMEFASSQTDVDIDRHEMQRVLLNLIKNAVDYTPPEGTITISVQGQGEQVLLGVSDTGPGVDPGLEPHLFTMYAPSIVKKYRKLGLGLGLYLSKQIIEAHGGQIGYERKPEGSLFYFSLPMEQAHSVEPQGSYNVNICN